MTKSRKVARFERFEMRTSALQKSTEIVSFPEKHF
jgi:hypothetical protein